MKEVDFSLATTEEIIKELALRAKHKRKQNSARHGTQKQFAEHIGMSFRSYQEFEISGKITLEKFIDVLRGLDALEESGQILKVRDEELFKVRKNIKKSSSKAKSEQKIVIPNVFE
jgi:transcriptional regulator with XRE-family HTH domain